MIYRKILSAGAAAAVLILAGCAVNQEPTFAIRGETVQRYFHDRFQKNWHNYRLAVENASTREDAQRLVEQARSRVMRSFSFPRSRTPLNARSFGKVDYASLVIEKISFQSREGFTVTGNFYLPKKFTAPLPGVVLFCGHASSGKYWYGKTMAVSLANDGYAVLVIDPFHQGERMQFPKGVGLTAGHNIINRHLLLIGQDFPSWRVWDGLRAIDYIRSRKEVDPKRIALTGTSGGGTLSTMVGACSADVAAIAPSCFITTFYHNVRNELPSDAEQIPVGFIADGGEMADLLIAQAPRPIAIIAQQRDFFDIDGARKSYRLVRKVYRLLGAEKNIRLIEGPGRHAFGPLARKGLHIFLNGLFKNGAPVNIVTAGDDFPSREELQVTPEGAVAELPGERNICDYAIAQMAILRQNRQRTPLTLPQMQKRIRRLLLLPAYIPVPEYYSLRASVNHPDYQKYEPYIFRFSVNTEPGMQVSLFAAKEDFALTPQRKVILYLPDSDSRKEMAHQLPVPPDTTLLALDYRGIGELEPNSCNISRRHVTADYNYDYHFASLTLLEGGTMISGRVRDILSVIKLLESKGVRQITVRAAGFSHAPAIFAALLTETPVKLELIGELITYEAAGRNDKQRPALQSQIPFGILAIADLDELLDYCRRREGKN